jgi:hypothetical protein
LTTAEIRRLFNVFLIQPIRDIGHHLHWSARRCHHQAHARQAHYQQRLIYEAGNAEQDANRRRAYVRSGVGSDADGR